MIQEDESNLPFYLQESIQKIIDFQWVTTKKIMKSILMVYLTMYCFPIFMTLFLEDEWWHILCLKIAILPACMLLFIESIQMYDQGYEYFMGWNIVDFSQICIFATLLYMKHIGVDDDAVYMPEVRLTLIVLSFMKLLFFIRIFEDFGFLVQMIQFCVIDLIPFIASYLVFLCVFSICFVVLKMEIDPEVAEAEGISYFEKMIL